MGLPSEIDPVFAMGGPATGVEVLDTLEIEGTTTGAGPELFLSRAPSPAEWLGAQLGPPAETRLSGHPGYLVTLRFAPR